MSASSFAAEPAAVVTVEVAATVEEGTAPAERTERERLTLAGRLGQHPSLRTSRGGVLIARFPRGVTDEADMSKTTWHQVLAFRERAAWVRDTLHRPGRNGPRTVEEINATVIKPRS